MDRFVLDGAATHRYTFEAPKRIFLEIATSDGIKPPLVLRVE